MRQAINLSLEVFVERRSLTYKYSAQDLITDVVQGQQRTQRFYTYGRLLSELQGAVHLSIFQHESRAFAHHCSGTDIDACVLLGCNLQSSVLYCLSANDNETIRYTPWGHARLSTLGNSVIGFNGERPDPLTGHYMLGGYRAFNPSIMRFNSPDAWSPFGQGGLNAYAYCAGDPVNLSDPSGHSFLSRIASGLFSRFKRFIRPPKTPTTLSVAELVTSSRNTMDFISGKVIRTLPDPVKRGNWVKMEGVINHGRDAVTFSSDKGSQVSLIAHGKVGYASVDGVPKDARQVVDMLSGNIKASKPTKLSLYTCDSAGVDQFHTQALAQEVANLTGIPTRGIHGVLRTAAYPKDPMTASHFRLTWRHTYSIETFYPQPQNIRRS